jgi:hypothetical protein
MNVAERMLIQSVGTNARALDYTLKHGAELATRRWHSYVRAITKRHDPEKDDGDRPNMGGR